MIRLRDKHGVELKLPFEVGFVEICDTEGNVACSVYNDSKDFTHILTFKSDEAKRYSEIFKVKFIPIKNIPSELKE
jgi:hypothetical protein